MSAFFSGVDDKDEKSDRFYGVIGNVNTRNPVMKFRLIVGDIKTEIEADDIFDMPEDKVEFPKTWLNNVKKFVPPKREKGKIKFGEHDFTPYGYGSYYGRGRTSEIIKDFHVSNDDFDDEGYTTEFDERGREWLVKDGMRTYLMEDTTDEEDFAELYSMYKDNV
jgi:hypothetical protein